MAGLNNLLSDSQQTTTTLPSWYDTAQQNIVNQGQQAFAAAPQLSQTTAQGAINTLQGPANPFTQAQNTLQQISSGAANPWITDASGNVTPDTSTAMGGLFQAQRQQLNQLLPNVTAPVEGANIASGNFGSLRGQTAVDKAKADAFSQLNAQQLQAALTNQQTGVQGAAQLGNVGQQGISSAMNVGTAQQNAPYQNVGNLASLLGTIQAPTTVTSQKQLSPLGQATALGGAVQGGLSALYATQSGKQLLDTLGLSGLVKGGKATIGGGSSGISSNLSAGTYPLADGGSMVISGDGTRVITQGDGTVTAYDSQGNSLGGSTNAGEGGNPAYSDTNLANQESGNTSYTPDQLDQYQNYYSPGNPGYDGAPDWTATE
jgi:hypothetical protein